MSRKPLRLERKWPLAEVEKTCLRLEGPIRSSQNHHPRLGGRSFGDQCWGPCPCNCIKRDGSGIVDGSTHPIVFSNSRNQLSGLYHNWCTRQPRFQYCSPGHSLLCFPIFPVRKGPAPPKMDRCGSSPMLLVSA